MICACRTEAEQSRPSATDGALPSAAPSVESPHKGQRVRVPAGRFSPGTVPGALERVPELEPPERAVEFGGFEIDALPYPNDPAVAPEIVTSADEAARRCGEAGGRLCTELEWERACKGPKSRPFSSGAEWNCPDPAHCRSAEGAYGMGANVEWTSSHFGPSSDHHGKSVARGAEAGAPPLAHRCARREPSASRAAFRCCYGPPNGLKVQEPTREQVYRKVPLTPERLRELLAAHPRTKALATDGLALFAEPDAARTVIDRGPGDRKGFDFTVSALEWTPVVGATFVAVPGRSTDDTSFVVVFHVLGDDQYAVASSFVMHDEPGPVAFAYSESIEPRFHFSTCWGCPGETGKVLYRKPDRAVIVQP
jgi:hypothetical protein